MQSTPEGYQVAAVEQWVRENIAALTPPFKWIKLEGGHSNLTYLIEDQNAKKAVIRRPPLGELLPKAHDMSREWSVISALNKTNVPVPHAYGFCENPEITGAWFYIMGWVEGKALQTNQDTEQWVGEAARPNLAISFIDALADLHAVEPDAVGLSTLGKKEAYIQRQINTWYRSWTSSAAPAQFDDPRAHDIKLYLSENIPLQEPAKIVHGDYGLHNVLVTAEGEVKAVVDWEICTLGDPLADLAYALNQWVQASDPILAKVDAATLVPGFPGRDSLTERYQQKTGRDLSQLDFYIGFNYWKSACILHGVYARYREGKKSTEGINLDDLRQRIENSLGLSQYAIDRLKSK